MDEDKKFWPIGIIELVRDAQCEITTFQHEHPEEYAKIVTEMFNDAFEEG